MSLLRRVGRHVPGAVLVPAARLRAERELLARWRPRPWPGGSRILAYHSVGTPSWGVNDVSPARFRRQLELALAAGYRFVPPRELDPCSPRRQLAVTFDDGLRSVAKNAGPVLAELGIPWSLFVVTDWLDGRHPSGWQVLLRWEELPELVAAGVTIGSHSVSHPDFGRLGYAGARAELATSRQLLRDRLGIAADEFAVPFGQQRNWTTEATAAAREAGYAVVYSQTVDRAPAGTTPRTFVSRYDRDRLFRAALTGAFDGWEEWY